VCGRFLLALQISVAFRGQFPKMGNLQRLRSQCGDIFGVCVSGSSSSRNLHGQACDVFVFCFKLAGAIHPQEARAKTAAYSFRLATAYFVTLRG